jgi:hypothetical protein
MDALHAQTGFNQAESKFLLVFKMKNENISNSIQDEMLYTQDATARTLRDAEDF